MASYIEKDTSVAEHQASFGSANSFAIILTRHSENLFLKSQQD